MLRRLFSISYQGVSTSEFGTPQRGYSRGTRIGGKIAFAAMCLSLQFGLADVSRAEQILREIKASGAVTSVSVPADYSSNVISFWALTKGNQTQLADFVLSAPSGAVVTARSTLQGRTAVAALTSAKNWVGLKFLRNGREASSLRAVGQTQASSTPVAALTDATSTSPFPSGVDPCAFLTPEVYLFLRQYIKSATGLTFSDEEICQLYRTDGGNNLPVNGGGGSGGSGGGSGNGGGFFGGYSGDAVTSKVLIRKDSCGQKGSAKYLVRFDVNIGRVAADVRKQGFSIDIGLRAADYRGDRASSLKPTSDGKYAPQPLILMTSIGYGAHTVSVVKWRGSSSIASVQSRKAADFVYWRGHALTRTPAGKLLTGGRGTVELSNGDQVYSLCFTLSRVRQRLAGYSG